MQLITPAITQELPKIPVHQLDQDDWAHDLFVKERGKTRALMDAALPHVPDLAFKIGDFISHRWLQKSKTPYLPELEKGAALLGRPGFIALNMSYEWVCTCRTAPAADGQSAELIRMLDWRIPTLGRFLVATKITGPLGPWAALTWPGYSGVLNAVAKGRFSAALNQAPIDYSTGFWPLDWGIARAKVWRLSHAAPAHLLRDVFETAKTYGEARQRLYKTPISAPCIFILTGLAPNEGCVIERREKSARIFNAPAAATNFWSTNRPDSPQQSSKPWRGHARGCDNAKRAAQLLDFNSINATTPFDFLRPPVLNSNSRLAMIGNAAKGSLTGFGIDNEKPVTQTLHLTLP